MNLTIHFMEQLRGLLMKCLLRKSSIYSNCPIKDIFINIWKKRIVSNDYRVTVDTNKYSVLVRFVGKIIKIKKVYYFKLEIHNLNMKLIDIHNILSSKALLNTKSSL